MRTKKTSRPQKPGPRVLTHASGYPQEELLELLSSIAVKDKGLPVSNGETTSGRSGRGKFVPPKGGSFGLAAYGLLWGASQ